MLWSSCHVLQKFHHHSNSSSKLQIHWSRMKISSFYTMTKNRIASTYFLGVKLIHILAVLVLVLCHNTNSYKKWTCCRFVTPSDALQGHILNRHEDRRRNSISYPVPPPENFPMFFFGSDRFEQMSHILGLPWSGPDPDPRCSLWMPCYGRSLD